MAKAVDHKTVLQLVLVIDDEGTNLTKREIDLIAGIIDGNKKEFTATEASDIRRIHQKRVVEGEPEYD